MYLNSVFAKYVILDFRIFFLRLMVKNLRLSDLDFVNLGFRQELVFGSSSTQASAKLSLGNNLGSVLKPEPSLDTLSKTRAELEQTEAH